MPYSAPPFAAGYPTTALPVPVPAQRSKTVRVVVICAAVLVVLICGGTIALSSSVGGTSPTTAFGALGPTASPTPTLRPVSASEYQTMLADFDAAVGPAMTAVIAAKNPKTLGTELTALTTVTQTSYDKLALVAPPKEVGTGHQDLLRAVRQLINLTPEIAGAATGFHLCGGSAAMAELTTSSAAEALRAASQELATVDPANPYKVGAWLPGVSGEQTRRLGNGTYLKKGSRTGSGQLKIDNTAGTMDTSFSLALVGSKTTAFTVYIRAGSSFTITGVKNGTYESYLSTGVDWDPGLPGFSRDCEFSKIDDSMAFTTGGGKYTVWTLTLSKAGGGNVGAGAVDPGDFPQ